MSHITAALRVLDEVASRSDPTAPITVGELARSLGITLSTASRLCSELTSRGLLARAEPYGAYRIGESAVGLSGAAASPFAHAVRFALTLVGQQTGEAAFLAVPTGGALRIVASVEAIWTLHSPAEVSEAIVDADSASLRAAAASDDRSEGPRLYESTAGESLEVATPVRAHDGECIAVVGVRFPAHRAATAARAQRAVTVAARHIERALEDWLLVPAGRPPLPPAPADRPTSLDGALRILRHLAAGSDTVAGIAKATGLRSATATRLIDSCRRAGFVIAGAEQGHLQLSWRMHGWHRSTRIPTLTAEGRERVAAVAVRTATCGFVTVLKGMRSFTIIEELEMVSEGLAMIPWRGRSHPIVGSDGGPTMLMDFSPEELRQLFPSRHTERDLRRLVDRAKRVRREGLLAMEAFDDGGMLSVSAPVRDASGTVCAAACLVATMDYASAHLEQISRETVRLADDLSRLLQSGAAG
ncbi:MarR family transcriptional regulator [Microbacterium fluvii]|uniref:MarR family transcriptional regulator n=1 Tax=Microbacterium fluvii TaxID=415215 RepID=A0ABW2HCR1_9MICO|nr:MarR family transcriptional regulator [Microbacterium fluvii]MCU4672750.1 MarR family transcriptional regulator [Microbacterium fluvii]